MVHHQQPTGFKQPWRSLGTFLYIHFAERRLLEVDITWFILFCYKDREVRISLFLNNMGDTVWDGANRTLFKTPNLKNYQRWCNVVRGKRTCTADMCVALDVQEENHSGPIDRKLIAQALQKRNLLRVAESIQISPNGRFCSIKFTTTQIMSIFCTEPLTISENNYIVFKPDYKPPQTRAFIFTSFLNVPLRQKKPK